MKAVIDDKIPYIKGQMERLVDETVYLPGSKIGNADLRDADILVTRTRTRCDRALLNGTSVKLIVTATIGFDHIDTAYCEEACIRWTNCPGCNANSVCVYVHNALLLTDRLKPSLTVGIVGVGHVGTLVARDLERCGMRVLLCDPPRADRGDFVEGHEFTSIERIQAEADIITFHTPLIQEGKYATYHLADAEFFAGLKKSPLIINASRGGVVDNAALIHAIERRQVSDAVIDTWENEPDIDRRLLDRVSIGTPHIAGYSADGKANATRMSLEAVADYLGVPFSADIHIPEGEKLSTSTLQSDCTALKESPFRFEELRSNYPTRRE